jgi:hypothetical protein
MGPVASFIVETAAQFSSNAGELFAQLTEELSDPAEARFFCRLSELTNGVKIALTGR